MEKLKDFINQELDYLKQQDLKFPNRHKEVHKGCCKHCPSANDAKAGITDPEAEDIKHLPKELILKEYAFVCAWRPNKLCKGFCDFHGIDQDFISTQNDPEQIL